MSGEPLGSSFRPRDRLKMLDVARAPKAHSTPAVHDSSVAFRLLAMKDQATAESVILSG